MNLWLEKSIELANQRNYLDLLYKVYPTTQNLRREISDECLNKIESIYNSSEKIAGNLLKELLKHELFPIKDSYIAYLKRDSAAIHRNPLTVARIENILYQMPLKEIIDNMTLPKESNRQIGPMFKNYIKNNLTCYKITSDIDEFLDTNTLVLFNGADSEMLNLAKNHFGYDRVKGLDFMAKNGKSVYIGEAKFLTDFGGHQNAQFDDAISTLNYNIKPTKYNVKTIAILDGVIYIKHQNSVNKMQKTLQNFKDDKIILSAIFLNEFIATI